MLGSVLAQWTPPALKSSWLGPWPKPPFPWAICGWNNPAAATLRCQAMPLPLNTSWRHMLLLPDFSEVEQEAGTTGCGCDQTWNSRATWKNSLGALGLPFEERERTRVTFALLLAPGQVILSALNDLACHLCRRQHWWTAALPVN